MSRIGSTADDVKASVKICDTLRLSAWWQLENVHTGFAIAQDGTCFKCIRLKSWFFCSVENVDFFIFYFLTVTCCKNVQKTLSNSRLCIHVVSNSEKHYKNNNNNNKKRRRKKSLKKFFVQIAAPGTEAHSLPVTTANDKDGCVACLYLAIPPGIYLAIP